MTRILIVGGGIAGTATALALHKAGFEATVYEAHPDSAEDIGAFLTLASNGMRALAQFDAAEAVAAAGFPLTAMRVMDGSGALVAEVPLGDHEDPRFRCMRRSELNQALQSEARRRGIEIRHSARLVALAEGPAGATATFADGSDATAELVIGADGLNSTVRSLVHPAAPGAHYAGQRVYYGYTTDAWTEAPTGVAAERITMIRGSRAAFGYAVSPVGETYWFARVSGTLAPVEEVARSAPKQLRDELVPLLRGDDTPAADIVAATQDQLKLTNACDLPIGTPVAHRAHAAHRRRRPRGGARDRPGRLHGPGGRGGAGQGTARHRDHRGGARCLRTRATPPGEPQHDRQCPTHRRRGSRRRGRGVGRSRDAEPGHPAADLPPRRGADQATRLGDPAVS